MIGWPNTFGEVYFKLINTLLIAFFNLSVKSEKIGRNF